MPPAVWLAAETIDYPQGGGHMWAYLNWALGLRALGCRIVWLETIEPHLVNGQLPELLTSLRARLRPYGLDRAIAIGPRSGGPLPSDATEGCIDLAEACEADLLLDLSYRVSAEVLALFRRSALVDIDPGLLQVWVSERVISLQSYDVYFSIGETVGQPGAGFPDCGLEWHYTPPCVATEWWPVRKALASAPFTTVSHWASSREWVTFRGESFKNDKRTAFEPFLDLPQYTDQPLELALGLAVDERGRLQPDEEEERQRLEERGWRVRHATTVASTPWEYQRYLRRSRGEFSCAKPSCLRLENAWISDRTICYLASGKPALVQHTGASRFLPDAAGLFRFRDLREATRHMAMITADYDRQCCLARKLAEEYFDARVVARSVLERALV